MPEGDGTVLDNTLVMYGSPMGNPNVHNHKRCPLFFAGHAGGHAEGRPAHQGRRRHADGQRASSTRCTRSAWTTAVVRRQQRCSLDLNAVQETTAAARVMETRDMLNRRILGGCSRALGALRAVSGAVGGRRHGRRRRHEGRRRGSAHAAQGRRRRQRRPGRRRHRRSTGRPGRAPWSWPARCVVRRRQRAGDHPLRRRHAAAPGRRARRGTGGERCSSRAAPTSTPAPAPGRRR